MQGSRGGPGFKGGCRGLRGMARLLRSYIQNFVQEVPVGPLSVPAPRFQGGRRGRGG